MIQLLDILCLIMLHQVRVHYCCSFIAVALLRSLMYIPLSSCLLRHINHLSWWWVFGEGDNAKAITCAWPIRQAVVSDRIMCTSVFAEIHKTPSIIYPPWNREGWRSAEDPSLPGAALLIHWPAGACLFPEATRWAMWEKEKGMSPNPSSTLSSFSSPHGDHTTFSCLEGPQLFFIINLSDPLASLWLLSNGVCRTGFTPAPRGKSLLSL